MRQWFRCGRVEGNFVTRSQAKPRGAAKKKKKKKKRERKKKKGIPREKELPDYKCGN